MKKVILTALIAFAGVTAANAQAQDQVSGSFQVTVNDYLDLTPSGAFGNVWNATFSNETEMNAGASGPVFAFSVDANRSWTATATTGMFTRTAAAPAGVSNTVDPSSILTWTPGGTAGFGGPITASTGGVAVAGAAAGGSNVDFTLQGHLANLYDDNMSGDYTSTTTIIAALN